MSEEEIISLRKSGLTINQIGKKLHIHNSKIMEICRKCGLRNLPIKKLCLRPPEIQIPMEDWKLAYLAGLMDGEGTLNTDPKKPQAYVGNTDKKMIDWILLNFKGHIDTSQDKRKGNRKLMHRWRCERTSDLYLLVKALIPFLITKKEEAEQMLQICKERLERSNISVA